MKSEGGFRKNEFGQSGMASNKPVISIITVVYNNVDFIEKTILSVINQTFKEREYIVIDGGSKDGTLNIIHKYQGKIDYWISEPDKGIYDAMNKGLHLANGTFVLFLNSGDLFVNDKVLERIFSISGTAADVYYGETNLIDSNGNILGTRTELTTRKLPKKLTWKDMKRGMVVSHQSIVVRKSIAPDYDLNYQCSADIDWVIESLKRSKVTVNVNSILSNYLIGGFSIKHQKKSWKERLDIYVKHFGFLNTVFIHFFIIARSISYRLRGKVNY